MNAQRSSILEVLLVEDNPGDVRLTEEAFAEAKMLVNLSKAWDGEEAMAFLKRRPPHEQAPKRGITESCG